MRNNLPAKQSASSTLSFAHCLNALTTAASQKACRKMMSGGPFCQLGKMMIMKIIAIVCR
jgi:hypothetical protein